MGSKTRLSIFGIIGVVIICLILLYIYPKVNVPPILKSGTFKTEIIERGQVQSYIEATGVVESENEVLILSPAQSIIQTVLKEPGSWVERGEIILKLNTENISGEIERITDQLEMKRNTLEKNRLTAQSTRLDLEYNEEVKKLKITSLKSRLADQEQLLDVGGISPAKLEQTKQEITLAEKDHQMLVEKNSIRLKQLEADENGLLLQIRAQEKELEEKKNILEKLDIKAPSAGIILNVAGNAGQQVGRDKTLVRMSDLSSFKIIGSVDENFAKQIKTGNRVFVKVDNEQLEGRIGNITPLVENKRVQFNVHLKEKSHPKLIANQNVEIRIISTKKTNVLRVKKCPELLEGNNHFVFVVEGNTAIKKEIVLGTIGNDSCEIISGVNEGDEIIIEGINAWRNQDKVEIQN